MGKKASKRSGIHLILYAEEFTVVPQLREELLRSRAVLASGAIHGLSN